MALLRGDSLSHGVHLRLQASLFIPPVINGYGGHHSLDIRRETGFMHVESHCGYLLEWPLKARAHGVGSNLAGKQRRSPRGGETT